MSEKSQAVQDWLTKAAAATAKWNELDRAIQAGEVTLTAEQEEAFQAASNAIDAAEEKIRSAEA